MPLLTAKSPVMVLKAVPCDTTVPRLPCKSRVAKRNRLCRLSTLNNLAAVVSTFNRRPFSSATLILPPSVASWGSNTEPFHANFPLMLPSPPSIDLGLPQRAAIGPRSVIAIVISISVRSFWVPLLPRHTPLMVAVSCGLVTCRLLIIKVVGERLALRLTLPRDLSPY